MIWKSKINQILVKLVDFFTVIIGFFISYIIWKILHPIFSFIIPPPFQLNNYIFLIIFIISISFVIFLNKFNAYKFQRFTSLSTEYIHCIKSSISIFFFSIGFVFLMGEKNAPRSIFIISIFIITILFLIQKTIMFYFAQYYRKHRNDRKKTILFGTGEQSGIFIKKIGENPGFGLDIVGLLTCDIDKVGKKYFGKNVLDTYKNIEKVLKNVNPQEVIITLSTRNFDPIRKVIEVCDREGVQVRLIPDFFSEISKDIEIDQIYGLNIISFDRKSVNENYLVLKRVFDILLSFIALIFFSPFMLFAIAGIIISDGFPLFYKWKIMGLHKKPIISWKFRTMVKNADELKKDLLSQNEMTGPIFKMENDPRIFKFGKFLRKHSIDELPQLFSVLKGDLSLIGPRPPLQSEFNEFDSWHRRKLSVKPGLTCLWQISGRNDINDFDKWAKLDLEYIDNISLWLDIKILFKTIPAIIKGTGK